MISALLRSMKPTVSPLNCAAANGLRKLYIAK
jgi:hypothetical protein